MAKDSVVALAVWKNQEIGLISKHSEGYNV
jgi:hypothetical protein